MMEDIRKQKRGPRVTRKYQTARNFAFNLGAKGTNARLDTRPRLGWRMPWQPAADMGAGHDR